MMMVKVIASLKDGHCHQRGCILSQKWRQRTDLARQAFFEAEGHDPVMFAVKRKPRLAWENALFGERLQQRRILSLDLGGRVCHLFDILIRITCRCLFSSFKLICQRSKIWYKNFHSVALPPFLLFEPAVFRVHSQTGKDNDSLRVCTCSRCRCLICSLNYKNSHCIEAGPRHGLFLLCNFYFANNFAPSSQTDTRFYNDHSWSNQSAVRCNSKFKDFIQLFLKNFFQMDYGLHESGGSASS